MSLYQIFSDICKDFVFEKARSVKLMIKVLLGVTPLRICKTKRRVKEKSTK